MTTPTTPTKPKSVSSFTSTPPKKSQQGTEHFATFSKADVDALQEDMAAELAGQFVGPMPVKDFISTFLPNSEEKPEFDSNFFNCLERKDRENQMYDPFIKLVTQKASDIIKGFTLVNTSQHDDYDITIPGFKNKPDVSCYKTSVTIDPAHPTRYEDMELIFEFKTHKAEANPFVDKPGPNAKDNRFPFEAQADARMKCRGQIASYARVWSSRQHRTHCFIIWIADPHARIIRFDRSGGIVSECFDYRENGDLLLNFLWSFSHSTDALRGLDGTVTKASAAEADFARKELFNWKTTSTRSVFKIEVPHPADGAGKTRSFLIWCPLADPRSVTGRATRGYAAWDLKDKRVVFLKDSWRSTEPGMEKEVNILRELNAKQCRYVPQVICGDDLSDQITVTKKFAQEKWNIGPKEDRFIHRVHTRFVERKVGYHITSTRLPKNVGIGGRMTPKLFLQVVFHAFIAHFDAYTKCGILHRDISGGNILVDENGYGFLNDWDLSRHVKQEIARQVSRSGTWQFMSAEILRNPQKLNTLQDDMESFFWLVLYHILRYMEHTKMENLSATMKMIFDSQAPTPIGEAPTGGHAKSTLLSDGQPLGPEFEVTNNGALTSFYHDARFHFNDWHIHLVSHHNQVSRYSRLHNISYAAAAEKNPLRTDLLVMDNHKEMMRLFEVALAENSKWAPDACLQDRCPETDKRRREEESAAEEDPAQRESDEDVETRPVKTPKRLKNDEKAYKAPGRRSATPLPPPATRTQTRLRGVTSSIDDSQSQA